MDEFNVRLAPNNSAKKHNVFKLHKDDQVKWSEAKMRRENDFQPWQIKVGNGRQARRFKAIKEGGIGENASYFVFYKSKDSNNTYEVCQVDDWFNMSATQRYKTLTAEEAEQKFEQRHKTLNYFSVMHLKKNDEDGDQSGPQRSSFKISEMDDWDESGDDLDDGFDDNGEDDESKPKQRKKKTTKKEESEDAPEEGKEDSDEGDFEQREVDYMSDTSESSASDVSKKDYDVKDIAEEEALRDLLSTDDEEDEPEKPQQDGTSHPDDSSDSDDYDVDDDKMETMFMKKDLPSQLVKLELKSESSSSNVSTTGASGGGSQQPLANKRKAAIDDVTISQPQPPPKRPCPIDTPMGQEKVIEDLIKKYLGRKPMTLKNLLKDIKSKLKRLNGVNGVNLDMDHDLVSTIATIIKRLNPERQKINDVTYFSLKAD